MKTFDAFNASDPRSSLYYFTETWTLRQVSDVLRVNELTWPCGAFKGQETWTHSRPVERWASWVPASPRAVRSAWSPDTPRRPPDDPGGKTTRGERAVNRWLDNSTWHYTKRSRFASRRARSQRSHWTSRFCSSHDHKLTARRRTNPLPSPRGCI